ncbi:phospholipase C, phosphocholine-specific [Paraburkholderia sp. Ac-20342]|uniref:phosphocholine-specific phospholipase C n=1 Tax=Paraburkholderia sp. Ac-20342 TaxID=2703889 RepID=UPI001981F601|nr:phospholipase C, phosphocholine-specific [Paraburkholderia sp. Ac-20342]MBN3848561.1 phospholipase C, phosphocholine-specific [Paraburkholderia sp. Ac-20342]
MTRMDRRSFLRSMAAGISLSALPPVIQRALAIAPNNATGTINDVEHIVIFMQENRSFDHFFGLLPGVRGFSDRLTIPTVNGSVWNQTGVSGTRIQPYYLNPSLGDGVVTGGDHGWATQHSCWNNGAMYAWPQGKGANQSMGYLSQNELPFYWGLANAFTICDHYHCSVHGPTFPNRLFLQTGTNGAVANQLVCDTQTSTLVLAAPTTTDLTWTTTAERLAAAGVSWKVYWYPPDPAVTNMNAAFHNFRVCNQQLNTAYGTNATYTPAMDAVNPLAPGIANTMPDGGFLASLANDVANGTLPQVSWVHAPEAYYEHPGSSSPGQGEWYSQQLLEILTSNPEVWSKTVLLINYDENDCFFDHMPPPCVPSPNGSGGYYGKSTVSTEYEYFTMSSAAADPNSPSGAVIGPGVRVPMLVVSPWSVGGYVNSQVFDHTSTLRFIEQRFGIEETNITPWRRAVMGDMTSCFNFQNPVTVVPTLPAAPTQAAANALYASQDAAGAVPAITYGSAALPTQPQMLRPSKALPYHLHTSANVDAASGSVWLIFSNTGTQAAVFHVYDKLNLNNPPQRYTVEAGKEISDAWAAVKNNAGNYDLWVCGPNGYNREFTGNVNDIASGANPEVRVCYDHQNDAVYLTIMNSGSAAITVTVAANAYRTDGPWTYTIDPGMQVEPYWTLSDQYNWYDFTVSAPTAANGSGNTNFMRRFAGRLENGQDGVSDPAMGVAV